MAQSLNTKVDLVMKGTSYHGMNNYGNIMIGDKGFEYYNQRKLEDYIQIPWEEIDYVIASVMFRGKIYSAVCHSDETKRYIFFCRSSSKGDASGHPQICSFGTYGALLKLF